MFSLAMESPASPTKKPSSLTQRWRLNVTSRRRRPFIVAHHFCRRSVGDRLGEASSIVGNIVISRTMSVDDFIPIGLALTESLTRSVSAFRVSNR